MKDASKILERKGGFVFELMSPVMNWERLETPFCIVSTFSNHYNASVMKITFSLSLFPMWCSPRIAVLLSTLQWTKPGIFFKHFSCNRENKQPPACANSFALMPALACCVVRGASKGWAGEELGSAVPSFAAAQGLVERPWKAQHILFSLSWSTSSLGASLYQQSNTVELQNVLWINYAEATEVACCNVWFSLGKGVSFFVWWVHSITACNGHFLKFNRTFCFVNYTNIVLDPLQVQTGLPSLEGRQAESNHQNIFQLVLQVYFDYITTNFPSYVFLRT